MPLQNPFDFDLIWDYAHPDKTEAEFHEILKQIPASNQIHFELLTQIARAQGLQRKFTKAHKTLDDIAQRLSKNPSRAKIRYLLERGRAFNSAQQPEKAKPLFEEALEMAKKLREDFYAIDALHMLAIISAPAESLEINLQAVELAESSSQEKTRTWLGSLYNNIGWAYHDSGNFKLALKMFKKAEAFRIRHGTAERRRIATWCIARTLRSLNRIEEALSKQMKLKEEFESIGESDGYVFEEIAECLLALKRKQTARPYFTKAYKVLSKDNFLVNQEPERIKRLKELGHG